MNYLVIKLLTDVGVKYVKYFASSSGEWHLTEDIEEAQHYNSIVADRFMGVLMNACSEFPTVEIVKRNR